MKYESKNRLCDFEFHDAVAKLTESNDEVLCLSVTYLNIHKDAIQNKETEYDLELGETLIRFEKPKIESVNRTNREEERLEVPHTNFLQNWSKGGDILSLVPFDHRLLLLIDLRDGFFEAEITYENVYVSWNDSVGLAWYEKHRLHKEKYYSTETLWEDDTNSLNVGRFGKSNALSNIRFKVKTRNFEGQHTFFLRSEQIEGYLRRLALMYDTMEGLFQIFDNESDSIIRLEEKEGQWFLSGKLGNSIDGNQLSFRFRADQSVIEIFREFFREVLKNK